MRIFNAVVMSLALLMAVMAVLPLYGMDLVLIGKGELTNVLIDESNLHLYMVRSAAFATFATFSLNYLRRRRPLSSVAPLYIFAPGPSFLDPPMFLSMPAQTGSKERFCFSPACLFLSSFGKTNGRQNPYLLMSGRRELSAHAQ